MKKFYRKLNLWLEDLYPDFYLRLYKNRLFIKYIISGLFTAVVDLVTLYLAGEYVFGPDDYLFAVVTAFFVAFFVSFFLQKFWTFRDADTDKMAVQMVLYLFIAFVNLFLNLFVIFVLVEAFGIWYFTAQIISGLLVAWISFILYNRYVFRSSTMIKGSVLLASGIFPPDVGGPSIHSRNFLVRFNDNNIKTGVVTYSDVERYPNLDDKYDIERVSRMNIYGIRHIRYFFRLLISSLKYEIIYAQDISAAGLPAMVVSKLLKRRFFLRIGGDLLWERLAEREKTPLSLVNFYKENKHLKYYLYHVGQSVLMRAEKIIVPTDLLAHIYRDYYGIDEKKIVVLPNPLPLPMSLEESASQTFKPDGRVILFAGRFVKYKNLEKLIIAFANVYSEIGPAKLILVGEGPEKRSLVKLVKKLNLRNQIIFKDKIPHQDLVGEIAKSSVCVGPALTEFNPNFILECLSLNKPVLLTKENGLSVKLPERFLIDAADLKDIENKIVELVKLDGVAPGDLVEAVEKTKVLSWDDIIEKHLIFFKIK